MSDLSAPKIDPTNCEATPTVADTGEEVEVLHVISGLGVGGAETMLTELVRRAPRGAVVVSLTPGGPNADRLRESGASVFELDLRRATRLPADIVALARLIRRLKPRSVQGWMYHGDLAATLALALSGRRRKTRLVWGVRCSDMDISRYGARLRLAVRACAALSHAPDVIAANSHAGVAYHTSIGYRARRWEVVDNGIDTDRFRPDVAARMAVRAELGVPAERLVLAHVARVDPMKDHETFLAALDHTPDVTALLVGQGTEALPARPNLIRLGRRLDMPRLLAASDFIVSSSAFGEGFSTALTEGMAVGLIPAATDVGDARRIIGATGAVVAPRDATALATAITSLARESADARAGRAHAARRRVVDNFSLARAADSFAALYRGS